jgi:8-oxo-dGTP diphosphatase
VTDARDLIRVACVILHRDGKVLLQHRDDIPEIRFPGHWAIFGGHVEPGETPEETAIREMEEELGLRLEGPLPLFFHHTDDSRERFVFHAPLSVGPEQLVLQEGQGMALLGPDELDDRLVIPVHREILSQFFGSIANW